MRRSTRILTSGIISAGFLVPNLSFGVNNNEYSIICISLEKTSVILGDTSKVSISFKDKQDADTIVLNLLCYDERLSTVLNYNSETNSYECIIIFDIDPEYLNVWEIESIELHNSENTIILDKIK